MDFAKILISSMFFYLFIAVITLNYLQVLLEGNSLRGSCPVLVATLDAVFKPTSTTSSPLGCDPLDANCKVGGGFSSGGGNGGGGGSSGAGGSSNWYDAIFDFFGNIYNMVGNVITLVGGIINQITNILTLIITLLTTNCSVIANIRIVLFIIFTPISIGIGYIIVRLLKSLIPTIGGD